MAIAALWDSSVGYRIFGDNVEIETSNGRVAYFSRNTFDHLYFVLDEYTAALKDDCIHYTEGPDYVELKNFMGQTRRVDYVTFHRNYDTLED